VQDVRGLMDKNFAALRRAYVGMVPPAVPYIGAFQKDLVYLEQSPTTKGDMVNLHKLRAISASVHSVTEYQSARVLYWFREVHVVTRIVESIAVLDEGEQHRLSLSLEPRESVANISNPLDQSRR